MDGNLDQRRAIERLKLHLWKWLSKNWMKPYAASDTEWKAHLDAWYDLDKLINS